MSKAAKKRDEQASFPARAEKTVAVVFQERPKIFLVDVDAGAQESLTSAGFNVLLDTWFVDKPPNEQRGDSCLCRLNYDIPENLHEYDIVVVDLKERVSIEYDRIFHSQIRNAKRSTPVLSVLCIPQKVFDPRPLADVYSNPTLKKSKKSICCNCLCD